MPSITVKPATITIFYVMNIKKSQLNAFLEPPRLFDFRKFSNLSTRYSSSSVIRNFRVLRVVILGEQKIHTFEAKRQAILIKIGE